MDRIYEFLKSKNGITMSILDFFAIENVDSF